MVMGGRFDDVLQRAERLIQSCEAQEPWVPVDRDQWPPERPPSTPAPVSEVFHNAAGSEGRSPWAPQTPVAPAEPQVVHMFHNAGGNESRSPWAPQTPAVPVEPQAMRCADLGAAPVQPPNLPAAAAPAPGVNLSRASSASWIGTGNAPAGCNTPGGGGCGCIGQQGTVPGSGGAANAGSLPGVLPGMRSAETAVLVDGLERENSLLRQQLDRCLARERAVRAEADGLQEQLDAQGQREQEQREAANASMAAEGARLRNMVQQQGHMAEAVAARLEALQGEHESKDAIVSLLQVQLAAAQAEVEGITRDVENLQQTVLPNTTATPLASDAVPAGTPPLQASLCGMRHAVTQLKLACDAKFETFGIMQQQLRSRIEAGMMTPRTPVHGGRRSDSAPSASASAKNAGFAPTTPVQAAAEPVATPGVTERGAPAPASAPTPIPGTVSVAAEPAALAQLLAQLQQARCDAEHERERANKMTLQLEQHDSDRLRFAKELEAANRSLRIREVEVKELQLIGKYFAGRVTPPSLQEINVAGLAEELRVRCTQLAEEVERLKAERDLLRAERDHVDRELVERGGRANPSFGSGIGACNYEVPGGRASDLALVHRILEQKKAGTSTPGSLLTSGVPMSAPVA